MTQNKCWLWVKFDRSSMSLCMIRASVKKSPYRPCEISFLSFQREWLRQQSAFLHILDKLKSLWLFHENFMTKFYRTHEYWHFCGCENAGLNYAVHICILKKLCFHSFMISVTFYNIPWPSWAWKVFISKILWPFQGPAITLNIEWIPSVHTMVLKQLCAKPFVNVGYHIPKI